MYAHAVTLLIGRSSWLDVGTLPVMFSSYIAVYHRNPVTVRWCRWYLCEVTGRCIKVETVQTNNAIHYRITLICQGLQYVRQLNLWFAGTLRPHGLWYSTSDDGVQCAGFSSLDIFLLGKTKSTDIDREAKVWRKRHACWRASKILYSNIWCFNNCRLTCFSTVKIRELDAFQLWLGVTYSLM